MNEDASTARPEERASRSGRLTDLLDPAFCARLDALDIFSRKILQGKLQGERRSKRRGQSVEFADHRPYAVGDDLRFLDWNIYARLDMLFLKLFLEEQDLTVDILVDVSESTAAGEPAKSWAIRRLAAALAYIGLVNNSRVTLSAFADGLVGQLANMRGRNYLNQMAQFLLAGRPEGPSAFEKSCRQLAAGQLSAGVVIVISDFLFKEGCQGGLRNLLSRRHDLYAIQMLSPQELDPPFRGDLRLIDIEDGDDAEVTINAPLLAYYRRTLAAFCDELKGFCSARGATYVLTNSAQPVEALILQYLRKRGLLR